LPFIAEFDPERLLASAIDLPRVDATLVPAQILARIQVATFARKARDLPSWLRFFSASNDLATLENTLRLYCEYTPAAAPALDQLFSNACPYIYQLQSLEPGTSRVALGGAYRVEGDSLVVIVYLSTLATGAVDITELWDWGGTQDIEQLRSQLERLFSQAHDAESLIRPRDRNLANALLFLPATEREFSKAFQARAASCGVRLAVPRTTSEAHNLIGPRADRATHLLVSWVRCDRQQGPKQVEAWYQRDAIYPSRRIRLTAYDIAIALDQLREGLREALSAPSPSPPHAGVLQPDGWYYLQKAGGNGRDVFTPRQSPCTHNNWGDTHAAPKAHKGMLDFFGMPPRRVERCLECHAYRSLL
jgi:hypothetical protein